MASNADVTSNVRTDSDEIKIISHSNLFYWWPIWALGYLFGLITFFSGHYMVVIPDRAEVAEDATVSYVSTKNKDEKVTKENRDVLILPKNAKLTDTDAERPHLHVSNNKNLGVVFAIVLILVIIITNVPLRGMWSMMVIFLIIALTIIFWLGHVWVYIIQYFEFLDIRINAAGYFLIATSLLVVWIVTMVFFDRNIYVIFTPGQVKECTEIGGGEQVYDAMGLSLQKQRSDLFRHWVLGLGSGDLIVKTSGAQLHQMLLPNVLFIGTKVRKIEEMLKKKAVVETKG